MTGTARQERERRPATYGRVLWMLAAGSTQVRVAGGLPGHTRDELLALLTTSYGGQAGALVGQVSDVVRALLDSGAHGALRLSGSQSHVLVQLVSRDPVVLEVAAQAPLLGECEAHGSYRSLGEVGSHHVGWAVLRLPGAGAEAPAEVEPDDVWG